MPKNILISHPVDDRPSISEWLSSFAQKKITIHHPVRGKKVGVVNCKKIYGNKFDKLISNVKEFSPELSKWLVTEGYGKVMGRKGLSLKEREMCNVAVLCSLKYDSQLYSHINGAMRLKN